MNWRRTKGHDKTVNECFPCLWPEINKLFMNYISVLSTKKILTLSLFIYFTCETYFLKLSKFRLMKIG